MTLRIRPAVTSDADALGRMGAALAKLHHDFDPERFFLTEDMEDGYRWWLGKELRAKDAVVLVAEGDEGLVGYAYGRLEKRDWNDLLDAHGGFHDLWVEPEARGLGAGRLLAEEMMARLTALGAPRVVLKTSSRNAAAQKLFSALGWRPTMVEMTREKASP